MNNKRNQLYRICPAVWLAASPMTLMTVKCLKLCHICYKEDTRWVKPILSCPHFALLNSIVSALLSNINTSSIKMSHWCWPIIAAAFYTVRLSRLHSAPMSVIQAIGLYKLWETRCLHITCTSKMWVNTCLTSLSHLILVLQSVVVQLKRV